MRLAKLGKEMLFSVEQAFVGREEIRAPLKTPAWEANQEFEDASNHRNEKKGGSYCRCPLPSPPNPPPFFPSSLSPTRSDSCYAGCFIANSFWNSFGETSCNGSDPGHDRRKDSDDFLAFKYIIRVRYVWPCH